VVMERVAGVNLATHIRRRTNAGKPFAVADAIDILAGVAEGLAAVHRAGIAHRDIKPDNIMLAPGGRVVIMDFGVFVPEFAMGDHSAASGSPAYMAPETISGSVGGGGGFLVDVYALGVMAFELLTGELPFPGATPREVYMKHLAEKPPTMRSKRADVPAPLDTLVSALLHKDASERPQSLDEVAHQLRSMIVSTTAGRSLVPAPSSRRMAAARPPPSKRTSSSRVIIEETPVVIEDDDTTK